MVRLVCMDVQTELSDYTVEDEELLIRMKAPLTVYSTDAITEKIYYYSPKEPEFYEKISDNFIRKYRAYYRIAAIYSGSNYVYRNDHRKNLSHDIRAVILLPGSELIACQEKENTLISFTRPDLERKMHRDLACLRFYENKIASFQQKKSVDLKAAKTLLL